MAIVIAGDSNFASQGWLMRAADRSCVEIVYLLGSLLKASSSATLVILQCIVLVWPWASAL